MDGWYLVSTSILPDEGPMLETLDYTIRIGSTPTFLYFSLLVWARWLTRLTNFQFVLIAIYI